MGGTVGVTIRRADGREHRMARWTNPFSHMLNDLAFIEGDDSFMDEYIAMWDDMRQDWIDNHKTEAYRHPMTPCYGDWPCFIEGDPRLGQTIWNVCQDMQAKADEEGVPVRFKFNGRELIAYPGNRPEKLLDSWNEDRTLQRKSVSQIVLHQTAVTFQGGRRAGKTAQFKQEVSKTLMEILKDYDE